MWDVKVGYQKKCNMDVVLYIIKKIFFISHLVVLNVQFVIKYQSIQLRLYDEELLTYMTHSTMVAILALIFCYIDFGCIKHNDILVLRSNPSISSSDYFSRYPFLL